MWVIYANLFCRILAFFSRDSEILWVGHEELQIIQTLHETIYGNIPLTPLIVAMS